MIEAATRAIWAVLTSSICCVCTMPMVIRQLSILKLGQMIQDDGPAHQQKAHIPTMAGLWLVIVWQISNMMWMNIGHPYFWILLGVLVGFLGLGIIDDMSKIMNKDNNLGLSPRAKFVAQFAIATTAVLAWFYYSDHTVITILRIPIPIIEVTYRFDLGVLYPIFAILVIVGSANSVNLTDGLDGLVSVPVILVCVGLGILIAQSDTVIPIEVLQGSHLVGYVKEFWVYLAGLAGVFMGFLWYNCHPAKVFLGDTGSMCVGAVLGCLALMLKVEVVFAIMTGLFVIEAFSVMMQVGYFKLTKKRMLLMAPIHHHFEKKGWSEEKVVTRFWLVAVFFLTWSLLFIF